MNDPLQRGRALRELPEDGEPYSHAIQARLLVAIQESDLLDLCHESVGRAPRSAQQRCGGENRQFGTFSGKQGEYVIELLEHEESFEV